MGEWGWAALSDDLPFRLYGIGSSQKGTLVVAWSEDAGKLGIRTADYLVKELGCREVGEIPPEGYFPMAGVNVEDDVAGLAAAGVDFIALDGFGGGTGATDLAVRENVGIPLIAALPRADRALRSLGAREGISLIGGGGLRTSADLAKCLALGADAVYLGIAALIAINCEQYRICHTGLCPTGVTTQDPILGEQLDTAAGIERLCNFVRVSTDEMAGFARVTGKNRIRDLGTTDLVAMKKELSEIIGCGWLGGPGTKE